MGTPLRALWACSEAQRGWWRGGGAEPARSQDFLYDDSGLPD
jgi:hypothetical protein